MMHHLTMLNGLVIQLCVCVCVCVCVHMCITAVCKAEQLTNYTVDSLVNWEGPVQKFTISGGS